MIGLIKGIKKDRKNSETMSQYKKGSEEFKREEIEIRKVENNRYHYDYSRERL